MAHRIADTYGQALVSKTRKIDTCIQNPRFEYISFRSHATERQRFVSACQGASEVSWGTTLTLLICLAALQGMCDCLAALQDESACFATRPCSQAQIFDSSIAVCFPLRFTAADTICGVAACCPERCGSARWCVSRGGTPPHKATTESCNFQKTLREKNSNTLRIRKWSKLV